MTITVGNCDSKGVYVYVSKNMKRNVHGNGSEKI